MAERLYVVVAYDVVSDRRRNRLIRLLKGYLEHVQKSVFEGPIEPRRFETLQQVVSRTIRQDEDSVRYYLLCRRCRQATEVVGLGREIDPEPKDVVL